jgi:glycerol 3-phosphatase-2
VAPTPVAELLVSGEGSPVPRAGSWPSDPGGTWVIDLDGVVWLTGEPIAGVPEALAQLGQAGIRTLFATNNSAPTVAELQERLARAGVDARPEDLVTSAQAAAGMVEPGSTVLALADGGVLEALDERGVVVVEDGPADAVIVGWTHRFDFDRLAQAATAVRDGARLIGTNEDPTHPTPQGLLPGTGAILAAVAAASGVDPEVAGKPHQPLAALVTGRASDVAVVVGDRPATDGLLAHRLGVPFALVLSGVTKGDAPPLGPPAEEVAPDLAHLVARVLQ